MGNLVRDPETRTIQSGAMVCKFTLGVNYKTKNKDEAMFVDCIAWEKLAEVCDQYLKKGMPVLVDGRLVIRNYENKEGEKRKATEVVVQTMQMLGKKDDNGASGSSETRQFTPRGNNAPMSQEEEDEIPF